MNLHRASSRMLALVLVYLASLTAVAFADDGNGAASGTLTPVIPLGQGESCVEDTDFMRRNHMNLLKHQRNETMLKGVRSPQHSLKGCINCHVVMGPEAKPVTAASPDHFCRSCHDFAAVSIDCFQCHASRPDSGNLPSDHRSGGVFPTVSAGPGTK